MNSQQRAMHLESAPRTFASRPETGDYATRDAQRELLQRLTHEAEGLTVADAVRLAQTLLVHVVAVDRFNYAEFQSATATEKYVKRAVSSLTGLPL